MKKPYTVCHMLTALDGKITGEYMKSSFVETAEDVYEKINEEYNPDAWLCGRVTTDENFTFYNKPDLNETDELVEDGDFVVEKNAQMYYVSLDTSGKIGWKSNTLKYAGRPEAHVIEILTEKASNSYKSFLRKMKISYIIAGEKELDYPLALEKLYDLFGIKKLMISGGGFVNWSFLQAGLIDELSVVIAPVADGNQNTVTLFEKADYFPKDTVVGFTLEDMKIFKKNTIWLKYRTADIVDITKNL